MEPHRTHVRFAMFQVAAMLPVATWQTLVIKDPGRLTPQLSMDSFLKGYFYTPSIKHPLKITASVPEPLIVMLWHRLLQALHQLEPSTCGILKLCHIRYITFQINSGKLYLKCAVSCYWFSTAKDKHGSFSSSAEVFLAALAKLGQRLQVCCGLPLLRQP